MQQIVLNGTDARRYPRHGKLKCHGFQLFLPRCIECRAV